MIKILFFVLLCNATINSQTLEESFYIPQRYGIQDSILINIANLDEDKFAQRDYSRKEVGATNPYRLPVIYPHIILDQIRNLDTCLRYLDTCLCFNFPRELWVVVNKGFHRWLNNKDFDIKKELEQYLPECRKLEAEIRYNATADTINGIYIPHDIEEAVAKLIAVLPEERLRDIKEKDETEMLEYEHLNLGHFIRNYWNLWGASRLNTYIHENYEVYHPESISSSLIQFLHRKLNGKELRIAETMQYYHEIEENME